MERSIVPGAIGIQQDQIDIGFARVRFPERKRVCRTPCFLFKQTARIANRELLPLPHVGVHVAAQERGDGLAAAAIDVAGKDHVRHQLKAGPVGFHEEPRAEFLNQRCATNGMHQREERALADG